MPTTLLIVYRVLGTVLFALAAAAIVEKYRTVRGAVLLPARVLECRRASSTSNSRGAGRYRTSEHRSMYSYVRLSIDRCTATYV